MNHRIAWPRPWGRVLGASAAVAAIVAAATLLAAPPALAQKKKPAAKPAEAAKPAQPAPKAAQNGKPQLLYSQWIKLCQKSPETNNKKVCVVRRDARLETGQPVLVAQIFEREGVDSKLQIIIPIPVHVQQGTRVLIDQQVLGTAPYTICSPQIGCTADYNADAATISKLKKGKAITVQAYNVFNRVISLPLPLAEFAKAYDGPPVDPKAFAAQQQKLQSELQKKAEAARKRLEVQQRAAKGKK